MKNISDIPVSSLSSSIALPVPSLISDRLLVLRTLTQYEVDPIYKNKKTVVQTVKTLEILFESTIYNRQNDLKTH